LTSIYISRSVDHEQWKQALGDVSVTGQSLVDISPVDFKLPQSDWVFFYSQNGVRHFFEHSQAQLAPYKWAAMGPKTSDLLREYVLEVDFAGWGTPQEVADQFSKLVSPTERVAFVQASQSRQSVQQLMPEAQVQSLVVYDNTPAKDIPSGKYDILVFTSPMNVEVFFQDRNFNKEVIIAIGPTTRNKLDELEIAQVQITQHHPEESLLVLLKQFI